MIATSTRATRTVPEPYPEGVGDLDLRHLRALVAVADTGSVTAAARRLGVAQPPLSRTLAALEHAVGTTLLERRARGTTLTPAGEAVLPHARRALRAAADVHEAARRARDGQAGVVRAGLVRPGYALLAEVLAALRAQRPGIELRLEPSTTAVLLARLDAGAVDLAVVAAPLPEPAPGRAALPLGTVDLVAALPRRHPLAARGDVSLADLRDERWVTLPDPRVGLAAHVVDRCHRAGFHPVVEDRAEEVGAVLALVGAGRGVTLVPRVEAVGHLPVRYVPVREDVAIALHLVWAPEREHAARDAVVEVVRAVAARGGG